LADERQRTDDTLDDERVRLVSGSARVSDLRSRAEFEVGARLREDLCKAEFDQALSNERGAEKAERAARTGLAEAQAEKHALGRHRQRFDLAEARVSEQAAEDEALDLHNHRDREHRS
jgi:hypothetical protein